jgi:rhodanese-related sulfurtransferase
VARRARGRLKQLVDGVEAEGWRFVALTRLVPLVPFNLLNYALGLTRIRLSHYTIATAVCMAPGAAAYAWLGYAGREAAAGNSQALAYGLFGLALLALVIFVPRLVRRLRGTSRGWISTAELKRRLDAGAAITVVDVRGPEEFRGPLGHIPGARNLPLSELARARDELAALGERPIVLVCATDKRSARAAELLRSAGFRDVLILRGGMLQWQRDAADARAPAPIGVET